MTITLTREEAQQVLAVLEYPGLSWADSRKEVAEIIRDRLSQCERCGEANPAEIHTCTPNYLDCRQWKYSPMTGEPLVDNWPLYSGLPQSEEGCAECGKKPSDGWALYCVKCSEREWQGLTDEEIDALHKKDRAWPLYSNIARDIEAKLKEKNT